MYNVGHWRSNLETVHILPNLQGFLRSSQSQSEGLFML